MSTSFINRVTRVTRVPIYVALLPALMAATALARPALAQTVVTDIAYRTAEKPGEQKFNDLDVYSPDTGSALPVVVYIHGGGWAGGDKSIVYNQAQFFTDNQVVYVSINHRLSFPMAAVPYIYPTHPNDVAAALAWISANIGAYGGDSAKVFLAGHSSGAHLAALLSVDPHYLTELGLGLDFVRGTIFIDGGDFDFIARYPTLSTIGLDNFNLVFGTNIPFGDWSAASPSEEAIWLDASPIEYVTSGAQLPDFLFLKAGSKTDTQPDDMAAAISANTTSEATLYVAVGKTHGTTNSDLGKPGEPMNPVILDFISSTLADGSSTGAGGAASTGAGGAGGAASTSTGGVGAGGASSGGDGGAGEDPAAAAGGSDSSGCAFMASDPGSAPSAGLLALFSLWMFRRRSTFSRTSL